MDYPFLDFVSPQIEGMFWGNVSQDIKIGETRHITVRISPSLRGLVIQSAVELNRIFGVVTIITSALRTWEEEDEIYPSRVERYGPGYQAGKPSGPHLYGRGIDWILGGPRDSRFDKAYDRGVEYLNTYFPYGYNAISRRVRGGKIIDLPYKTALAHNVGRGFHIHTQESWRG